MVASPFLADSAMAFACNGSANVTVAVDNVLVSRCDSR
jgi:hypothetical protein